MIKDVKHEVQEGIVFTVLNTAVSIDGEVFPMKLTQKELAEQYGISQRSVRRRIHKLTNGNTELREVIACAYYMGVCAGIEIEHRNSVMEMQEHIAEMNERYGEVDTVDTPADDAEVKPKKSWWQRIFS